MIQVPEFSVTAMRGALANAPLAQAEVEEMTWEQLEKEFFNCKPEDFKFFSSRSKDR